jgi:hypothetical protein
VPFVHGPQYDPLYPLQKEDLMPKWRTLKAQIPDYTCPVIDELYDWLKEERAPDWTFEVLDQIRSDNVNLRAISKDAIRALRQAEES